MDNQADQRMVRLTDHKPHIIIVLHITLARKVKVLFFYHKRRNEMSYKLVIAEKPSVAQSIAKVIGADKREDRYLEARRRNQNDK